MLVTPAPIPTTASTWPASWSSAASKPGRGVCTDRMSARGTKAMRDAASPAPSSEAMSELSISPVGGHQQDAQQLLVVGAHDPLDDLEVEDRLLHRDGDQLLDLEPERRAELRVGHGGKLGDAGDDPLVAHADDNALGLEAGFTPESPDGGRDGRRVDDLAGHDGADWQRHLPEPLKGG